MRSGQALAAFLLFGGTAVLPWRLPVPTRPVGTRTILDERGRLVPLAEPLGPQAVFMGIGVAPYLFATRDPQRIVTSRSSQNLAIARSSYLLRAFPHLDAMRMPLRGIETGGANIETLLRLRPGVVVTWARLADSFERVGLPVAAVAPVASPERLDENTRLFTAIVGETTHGRESVARSHQLRASTAALVAERARTRPRLLFLFPRSDGRWQAAQGFPTIVAEAGGIDIGAGLPRQAFLDAERLTALAPDVIVIIGAPAARVQTPRRLMATPALAAIPAVRTRRVYLSPPGFSGFMTATSVELPIYARWLADILHPAELRPGARALAAQVYAEQFGPTPTATELDHAFVADADAGAERGGDDR